jgi:hypothetical protein
MEQKDSRDEWRYVLLLYQDETPVWLEFERVAGLPQGIADLPPKSATRIM